MMKLAAVLACGLALSACGGGGGDGTASNPGAPGSQSYIVTPSVNGSGGAISPAAAVSVPSGTTTSFTLQPASGYTASVGGTCGGTLSGTTYTTKAITANCTVVASFAQTSAGGSIAACFTASVPVSYQTDTTMPGGGSVTSDASAGPGTVNGQAASLVQTFSLYGSPVSWSAWGISSTSVFDLGQSASGNAAVTCVPKTHSYIPLDMQPGQFVEDQFGAEYSDTCSDGTTVASSDPLVRLTFIGFEPITLAGKTFSNTCHFRSQELVRAGVLNPNANPSDVWFAPGYGQIKATDGAGGTMQYSGSGPVASSFKPTRFITVGDGFADVGQNGYVFTINSGPTAYNANGSWDGVSNFNWVQELTSYYGVQLKPAVQGCNDSCWGYAQGYARIDSPDTTSGTNAPSVRQQIDALLARTRFADGDVMMLNSGIADIVAAVNATGISDATTQTVQAAGKALGDQVQRVVNAGAKHVVVTGVYSLGHTPWANKLGQSDAIDKLSTAFNDALALELSAPQWTPNVLYLDAAQFFNLIYNAPSDYRLNNILNPVCTTPDASTCTASTLVAGADPARWMFADGLYFTPTVQRWFADGSYLGNIYDKFKARW